MLRNQPHQQIPEKKAAGERRRPHLYTPALRWTVTAAVVLLFAAIYDHFSHGVHSGFMDFAFLIPLAAAAVHFVYALRKKKMNLLSRDFLVAGITTLTAASLMQGIFAIAGTSSPYTVGFVIAGAALLIVTAITEAAAGQLKEK